MAGPWEKYQTAAPAAGPWEKFKGQAPQPDTYAPPTENRIVETGAGRFLETPDGQMRPIDEQFERALEMTGGDLDAAVDLDRRAEGMKRTERTGFGGWLLGKNRDAATGAYGQILKGIPFVGSYADEAVGAVEGALGGDGEALAEEARNVTDAFKLASPGDATYANLLGAGLALPAAFSTGSKLLQGGSLLSKVLRGIGFGGATGGAEGYVYGYGEGEGDARSDTAERGAMIGTALGAGIGGAMPLGGALAEAVFESAAGRQLRKAARNIGLSDRVGKLIAEAVEADAPDAGRVLSEAGESATLGGLGPSTRALLDSTANAAGEGATIARRNIGEIVEGASGRLNQTLDDVLGSPRAVGEITEEIMNTSRPARRAAYDAAYSKPIDYSSEAGRRLEGLLSRVDDSVLRRAERLMRAEGVESPQIMAMIDDAGRVTFQRMPDVRQVDYITRALRDSGGGLSGLGPDETRVLRNLSSEIREATDALVPEYRAARDIAADAISQRNAVELGSDIFKRSLKREDLAAELRGMSQSELVALRQGVRSEVDEILANARRAVGRGSDDAASMVGLIRQTNTPAVREKLEMILGPEESERLIGALTEADHAFSMQIAVKSPTAPRLAIDEQVKATVPGSILRDATDRGPVEVITGRLASIANRGGESADDILNANRSEIARTLTEPLSNPARVPELARFAEMGRRTLEGAAQARRSGTGAATATGASISPLFRPETDMRGAQIRKLQDRGYSDEQILFLLSDPEAMSRVLEAAR